MIDVGRLYEPFSIPLEVVENPIIGEIYYNSEGHALLCTGENEFRFIRGANFVRARLLNH